MAIDGKTVFDLSTVRELKWELSPRGSHQAPLCRGKARTRYPWVRVLSPLSFAAELLVEDALAGDHPGFGFCPQWDPAAGETSLQNPSLAGETKLILSFWFFLVVLGLFGVCVFF